MALDRPGSEGGEAKAEVRVESVNGAHECLERNLLQVLLRHSPVSVTPGEGNREASVCDHELVAELDITGLDELEEALIDLISGH